MSKGNWGALREPRIGVLLHYDASASDAGAVAWLTRDPRCAVSYNVLVLDDGQRIKIAPDDARAWHAGVCRPSSTRLPYKDANSAFYGLAFAAKPGDVITPKQLAGGIAQIRAWFLEEGWPLDATWRITSHHLEAHPRGRKHDIVGVEGLSLEDVRARVARKEAA